MALAELLAYTGKPDPWAQRLAWLGLAGDWMQTTNVARNPERFYEMNPLLGQHPSAGNVNTYFALAALGMLGGGKVLPEAVKPWWYRAWAALELANVLRNRAVGINFSTHF